MIPSAERQVDATRALAQVKAELMRRQGRVIVDAPKASTKKAWPPDYAQVLLWRETQLARFKLEPHLVASAKAYYKEHPVEFINHWCDTFDPRNLSSGRSVKLPLILFPKQVELIEFLLACLKAEQSGLVEKSRDMGATWVCCAFSVWLWLFWPGASIGWGSRHANQVDQIGDPSSIFEKLRLLIRGLPQIFWPEGFSDTEHLFSKRCINPATGATITGEIGDNIGRGGRTLIYFVDEAAHLEHPAMIEGSLMDTTRVRIDISSVAGLGNVFHRKRESGELWEPGTDVKVGLTNVFIMDWSDHPEKTEEWFRTRKDKSEREGSQVEFAREVERDYAAAQEGVIIPAEWVRTCVDAHKISRLNIAQDGNWGAALDVADGGGDRNALVKKQGVILRYAKEWGERDTGVTTRRAIAACEEHKGIVLQYDSVGVGSGVKAEANRLKDDERMPRGMKFVPWSAGASVMNPGGRVVEGDLESPLNKNFYANLKAQGWWELRGRCYRTFRAVTEGEQYDPETLISLDSDALGPLLRQIEKELSQATVSRNTTMKLVVDKSPEGTRSPNIADGIVMVYWPLPVRLILSESGLPIVV